MLRTSAFVVAILLVASTLLTGTATGSTLPASATSGASTVAGMKVLLVNDDGVQARSPVGNDGEGLYELRKALCAAGADVLTVGPWGVQSGMGGRITTGGPLTVQAAPVPAAYQGDCAGAPSGGKVFGVCSAAPTCEVTSPSASPSDVVQLALTRFVPDNYWAGGPDIVLSGINFGANVGLGVFHSGTTSAAVTAHELGEAAMAFSQQVDIGCLSNPSACPTFTANAAFAVKVLAAVRGLGLVDPHLLLNVNYPDLTAGETVGRPVVNQLGTGTDVNLGYSGPVGADGGSYSIGIAPNRPETRTGADTTALTANRISIVPLSGDWTARGVDLLATLLERL